MKKIKNMFVFLFIQIMIKHLIKLAYNFLKEKNIQYVVSNINLIINKCNGDRGNLKNELKKIKIFLIKMEKN